MNPSGAPKTTWYQRIPKVELHLHLEGAIPHAALWELIQKYGGDPTVPTAASLPGRFEYRDFDHFIETWAWKNGFLREYEDFEFIAAEIAQDLASQRIRYVEAFYSPGDFLARGLEPGRLTEAIRAGLHRCANVEIALVADLIRDHGPDRAARMLAAVHEVRAYGVIGVGIGGSENAFPPEDFEDVFREARDEVCVTSNLRTGGVASIKEHPVRLYFDRGIPISINTDDPRMFGTTLAAEYATLVEEAGLSRADIETLILQAAENSWLNEPRKEQLLQRLRREFSVANGA